MASSDFPLSPEELAQLSMKSDEFQVHLAQGGVNDWDTYVKDFTGDLRLAMLTELALRDLEHRIESGENATLEEYLERFAALGSPAKAPPPALVREFERLQNQRMNATQHSKRPFPDESDSVQPTRTVRASGPPKVVDQGGAFAGEPVMAGDQQYDMVSPLGRGAFGEVWLAKKKSSGIMKAVKILHQPADEDVAKRELDSLELIKNLRHPYLLATEDFWIASNKLYIVTELADKSLRKHLSDFKDNGKPGIPEDELLGYILEAADGFDFLHSKLITHRDVKPDNILIVNGHAKVADFGLARKSEANVAQMSFAGTPAYMAPEVWGGEGGPPSDLYGFAVTYVELRQGSTPFKMGKVMEMMQSHLTGQYDFADFIDEPEREVLRKAMSRNPEDRHHSCLAFAEDLADALGRPVHRKSGGIPMPRARTVPVAEAPPPPAPRTSKKRMVGIGVGLLVAAILGAFAVKGFNSGGANSVLPKGAIAEGDVIKLADGRRVPQWVVVDRGGEQVRFRLITPSTIPPFYISQSKVWSQLYNTSNDAKREEPGGPFAPAMYLTANEAATFAASFEGRLPTPEEWDHAAGLYDADRREKWPLKPSGRVTSGKDAPGPTYGPGTEIAQNENDLVDMAGNGREWTSAVLPGRKLSPVTIDGAGFKPRDLVVLRGSNYTLKAPLTYSRLEAEAKDPQTQFAEVKSPYTGFRIVLPVP